MFDFDDVFGLIGIEGTRATRIATGAIGALVGGGIGYFYAAVLEKTSVFLPTLVGALAGGALGALFSVLVLIGLVTLVVFAAVFAWQIFVKG